MKRNKKNSDFFSKKRSKYKLTFFNESSLEDVWTICFSRFGAIMTAILLIGLIVVAILSVIVGTPVKNLLPGYLKTEERIEMVDKILRVDSLAAEVQRRDAYIKNLASILTGEIKIDSIGQQSDSLLSTTTDTDSTPTNSPTGAGTNNTTDNDNSLMDGAGDLVDDTGNAVGDAIDDIGNTVGDVIDDAGNAVGGAVDNITDGVSDITGDIVGNGDGTGTNTATGTGKGPATGAAGNTTGNAGR